MKYLEKFSNYLFESNEDITDLSKEELDELLSPISDLGLEYSFSEPRTIVSGEYSGHKSMNIQIKNTFLMGEAGGYSEQIIDAKFWTFLDELISLKNRLESSRVSINTNWKHYIIVTFVQKEKVEGDLFKVEKLYKEMGSRINASKSDFSNNMSRRLNKDELKITVNCSGFGDGAYTDRKWNGLFRGIDFSEFNIEKNIRENRWGEKLADVTITLKQP